MRFLAILLLAGFSLIVRAETVAGVATLIDLSGSVEVRARLGAPWQSAKRDMRLTPGYALRTGKGARAALLLSDRTQIRLNENTSLDVVALGAAPRSAGQTKFRQNAGRAWVQSKTPPKTLEWQTPTAVAGIRGTDWEMAVDEAGQSTLSVFSGAIAFGNEQGQVQVAADEQAVAEAGKAPVKLTVRNLKDRIQWVSAYQTAPWRFVSLDGDALPSLRQRLAETPDPVLRGRILADLGRWPEAEAAFASAPSQPEAALGLAWSHLRAGRLEAAGQALVQAGSLKDGEAWQLAEAGRQILAAEHEAARTRLGALSERADLSQPAPWLMLSDLSAFEGRLDQALAEVGAGLKRFPDHPGLLAREAELLLADDRVVEAMAASDAALDRDFTSAEAWRVRAEIAKREGDASTALSAYDLALAMKPDDDRAWFGRGAALAERDRFDAARTDLDRAITLNPAGLGYQGELGALYTAMAEYPEADAAYRQALAASPADYVAQTGLGVLELKRGHPDKALEHLLKAGVMEPRYARAHVYTAVAYWQLGDHRQAREELARASALDDKDPLPHFMAAMMANDLLQPADAVESARAARLRLPYLKSLNALANDQQGSANLGQAFAFMGLEDWARAYAQDSYSPFWAGSHLFLADRYTGLFTKNSALFQGLLTDPTVFGTGNRFQPLIQAPARHLDLSLRYTTSDTVDGFSPQLQYSGFKAEPTPLAWYLAYENVDWDLAERPYELDVFTAALGLKPRHDLGLFVFADASTLDSEPAGSLGGLPFETLSRLDTRRIDLGLNYKRAPDDQVWLKAGLFQSEEETTGVFAFSDIQADGEVDLPEFSFRHSFAWRDAHQVTWGADYARRDTKTRLDDLMFDLRNDYRLEEHTLDLYVSDRFKFSPTLTLQADLVHQQARRRATDQPYLTFFDPPEAVSPVQENLDDDALLPRLGAVWHPDTNTWVRVAWQHWRRPAGMSALGHVATAGIPLDDRLVRRGGDLERLRVQGEWEVRPDTFVTGFLDYKDIDNQRFEIRPFTVSELESLGKLRPRDYGQLLRDDLYEFTDAPDYAGGHVRQAGFAINHQLNRQWALAGRYVLTDSEQVNSGLDVPFLARHTLMLGATWIRPEGWYLAGRLAYRDDRFADEANSVKLEAGWSADLDLFWQSRDKHWLVRFSANDLGHEHRDSQYTAEVNYRF
ncbi:MAG: tetratricopeptide repeat protein [Pseudomonadota bacterium]